MDNNPAWKGSGVSWRQPRQTRPSLESGVFEVVEISSSLKNISYGTSSRAAERRGGRAIRADQSAPSHPHKVTKDVQSLDEDAVVDTKRILYAGRQRNPVA